MKKKFNHFILTSLLKNAATSPKAPSVNIHVLSIARFHGDGDNTAITTEQNREPQGKQHVKTMYEEKSLNEALASAYPVKQLGVQANPNAYVRVLQECVDMKALDEGKAVHAHMIKAGCDAKLYTRNNLVNMYAKCGRMTDAHHLFDKMSERNVVSWTTMITGYTQHGHGEEALKLFSEMLMVGIKPNQFTFGSVIRGCSSLAILKQGQQIHAYAIKTEFELDVFVGSALIDMYTKSGSLEDARHVFDKMPELDLVSWNSMIVGYSQHGLGKEAIRLFQQTQQEGLVPNNITFASFLSACVSPEDLEHGKQVHSRTVRSGLGSDVSVGSALVTMYSKCESTVNMCKIFDRLPKRDVVAWNAMVAGYVQQGRSRDALKIFCDMKQANMKPNQFTLASLLRACASLEALESGHNVHVHIIKTGFNSDVFAGSALVDMYAKCGNIEDASRVFHYMLERNVVSWNVMIAGYAQRACGKEALQLFEQMHRVGMKPNEITFASVLSACASPEAMKLGKQVHANVIKTGSDSDVFVGSALVDMYAKCGSIAYACQVFDNMPKRDVVLWTAMIASHGQYGQGKEALTLFLQMQREGVKMEKLTITSVLSACACLAALDQGSQLHAHVIKSGFESNIIVTNALVNFYAKCRSLKGARQLFDNMPKQDDVSWNVMTAGYAQNDCSEEAVELFLQMQQVGLKPDEFTCASVLSACASLAALQQGNAIHAHIIKTGYESNVIVRNTLVDMYAKCGSIEDAQSTFDKMPKRDVVSWTAMISGFAHHGHGKEALKLFEKMQRAGIEPNHITFVVVLSACSHEGLVNEGRHYFNSMCIDHNIKPTVEHCACMVDLFGRAGCLDQAESFISEMPFKPDDIIWRALLGACRIHGNTKLGKRAAECVLELAPQDDAAYVLLCNIYAGAGRWADVARVRQMMKAKGTKKEPGCSWIEVKNRMHVFVAGDSSHP
eukprot:Gb_35395 [translate_table: standard]